MKWMPIESAPRDMTEVIVLCGQKDVRLGWYFAPSSITRNWLDQNGKKIDPTHWMPLPEPPAQERGYYRAYGKEVNREQATKYLARLLVAQEKADE